LGPKELQDVFVEANGDALLLRRGIYKSSGLKPVLVEEVRVWIALYGLADFFIGLLPCPDRFLALGLIGQTPKLPCADRLAKKMIGYAYEADRFAIGPGPFPLHIPRLYDPEPAVGEVLNVAGHLRASDKNWHTCARSSERVLALYSEVRTPSRSSAC
jgi:hypothetical protein